MIRPILDNVLIRPLASENISAGGIIVPGSFQTRNNKAEVVASGHKSKHKKGDIVYNIQNCGDEIEIHGVTHFLIKDSYILASEN